MSKLRLEKVRLLRLFLLIVLLFLTFNSPLHSKEFEKKVREHVIKYYVNDIFFDVQEQIKQKIKYDVKNQEINIKPEDLDKIANIISYNIAETLEEFVPDVATKIMMKYYTENEIDILNDLYATKTDDDLSFAKKNYYFQRELNATIMTYLYNNIESMIESELTYTEQR
ncbi:MAG: spore germination protein GerPC [Pseudomonadota bacterium]|nr:spore germination protein GerPC [Pseudomonadota bacterium]